MKRKRILPLLLVGLLTLALCACGGEPAAEEPTEELPPFAMDADFSPEESMAMSNFNACGIAIIEDNVFYGRWLVDGSDNFQLVRVDLALEGDFLEPGDWSVLHEDTYPNYINKVGDTLYFLDQGADDSDCVAKVDIDGQNYTVLAEDGFDFLSLHNDRLYFSDGDHNYCSTDLEGGDRQTVLEGSVYDPYFLTDDWFLYRDMNDGESLHLYNVDNGRNETLYAGKTSPAILWGADLFFGIADESTEGAYHLAKMDLSAITTDENGDPIFPEPEVSEELFGGQFAMGPDGYLYGGTNGNGSNQDPYWKEFKDQAWEEGARSAELFFSQANEIRDEYDEEGLLNAMYVYDSSTGGGNSFGKLK